VFHYLSFPLAFSFFLFSSSLLLFSFSLSIFSLSIFLSFYFYFSLSLLFPCLFLSSISLSLSLLLFDGMSNTLERVSWRVDVAISNSSLARVFRPTVLLQLDVTSSQHDGPQPISVELSVDSLARLRYQVARALKHCQTVEEAIAQQHYGK